MDYINTYIERDIKDLAQVGKLNEFETGLQGDLPVLQWKVPPCQKLQYGQPEIPKRPASFGISGIL